MQVYLKTLFTQFVTFIPHKKILMENSKNALKNKKEI